MADVREVAHPIAQERVLARQLLVDAPVVLIHVLEVAVVAARALVAVDAVLIAPRHAVLVVLQAVHLLAEVDVLVVAIVAAHHHAVVDVQQDVPVPVQQVVLKHVRPGVLLDVHLVLAHVRGNAQEAVLVHAQ